jgi:hypothetical protein
MPEGFKGDAHALLVAVYRDTSLPLPIRLDAAKAAVKFEKPVLAATTFTKPNSLGELTVDELRGLIRYCEMATGQQPEAKIGFAGQCRRSRARLDQRLLDASREYALPDGLRWPSSASSSAICCRDRLSPVFGLRRASRWA